MDNGNLIFSYVVKRSFELRESGETLFQELSLLCRATPLDRIM
jgi:hypothetical protein